MNLTSAVLQLTCPLCDRPVMLEELAQATWLAPGAVNRLEIEHPWWRITDGACPECVREATLDMLVAQGEAGEQAKVQAAWPLRGETAFGVLPTYLRLNLDERFKGRGTTLAMIDSAFYPHPDLVEPRNRIRAWVDATKDPVNVVYYMPEDMPVWPAWDSGSPEQWHGMMTTTVAAGNGQLSHGLYRGLASEADLVLLQVMDAQGRIGNANIANALLWLYEHGEELGVNVVNLSVGGREVEWAAWNPVDRLIEALVEERGMVVVAAAGNEGERRLVPPATAPDALTVGGLDDRNNFNPAEVEVWHSNYGDSVRGMTKPELVAPSIWVAAPVLPGTQAADEAAELFGQRFLRDMDVEKRIEALKLVTPYYQHVEGTSFAAPLVSSLVCCLLEANPALTPDDVREILVSTAEPVPGAEHERQGAGALSPGQALAVALRMKGTRNE